MAGNARTAVIGYKKWVVKFLAFVSERSLSKTSVTLTMSCRLEAARKLTCRLEKLELASAAMGGGHAGLAFLGEDWKATVAYVRKVGAAAAGCVRKDWERRQAETVIDCSMQISELKQE
ncbi:unnamed protein product [Amoebophrya sp. A25]|nr:unnamed protein product [Amoebophrya sp. A25]|eukprot:GSA25T00014340001.1